MYANNESQEQMSLSSSLSSAMSWSSLPDAINNSNTPTPSQQQQQQQQPEQSPYTIPVLSEIHANLPIDIEKHLRVRQGEPNTIQLLKLSIRAFFNNVLRAPFLEQNGNNLLKALWLLQNIGCAQSVYKQYNYLDYFPYILDNTEETKEFLPPFMTIENQHDTDVVGIWRRNLERLPRIRWANKKIREVVDLVREEAAENMIRMAEREKTLAKTLKSLAVNQMFHIGEYHSTLDQFVDMFVPVDRDDDRNMDSEKEIERQLTGLPKNNVFSDRSICLLTRSSAGDKVLTILSTTDLNK